MTKEQCWTVEVDDHESPPDAVFHCEGPAPIAAWLERWLQQESESPTGVSLVITPPAIYLPADEPWSQPYEAEPSEQPAEPGAFVDWYSVRSRIGKELATFEDRSLAVAFMCQHVEAVSVTLGDEEVEAKSRRRAA